MAQFRTVPTFTQAWTPGNKNDSYWYRYFQAAEEGQPPSGELPITVQGSPFTFTATKKGFVVISGGTVTSVMFSRTPGTFYLMGTTAGAFPMAQNDMLKVTYTGMPVMTFVPT